MRQFRGSAAAAPLKRQQEIFGPSDFIQFRGSAAAAPLKRSRGYRGAGHDDNSAAALPRPH